MSGKPANGRESSTAALRVRAAALRAEIKSTRERAQRVSVALQHKERSLTRLEALIALSGDDDEAPQKHE